MSEPAFLSLVAEILEISPADVHFDSDLELLGWDSLSNLTFLSIADDRYHVSVDAAALAQAETPADLVALLHVELTAA
jgi:acyl carrier protein